MYGLVRSAWLLNQNSQSVSESVSESVSQRGGYRAARAAKKSKGMVSPGLVLLLQLVLCLRLEALDQGSVAQ